MRYLSSLALSIAVLFTSMSCNPGSPITRALALLQGNDVVELQKIEAILGTSPVEVFSVSFWMKYSAGQVSYAAPLGATSNWDWLDGFGFYVQPQGTLNFFVNDWNSSNAEGSVPEDSGWHHITGVFESGTIRLYIDGALADTSSTASTMLLPETPVEIGRLYGGEFTANFPEGSGNGDDYQYNGLIDNIAIWNVALTADAIESLFNNGAPHDVRSNLLDYQDNASLVGYWRIDANDRQDFIRDHRGTKHGAPRNLAADALVEDVAGGS